MFGLWLVWASSSGWYRLVIVLGRVFFIGPDVERCVYVRSMEYVSLKGANVLKLLKGVFVSIATYLFEFFIRVLGIGAGIK